MRSKIAPSRPTSFRFSAFPREIIEINNVTALILYFQKKISIRIRMNDKYANDDDDYEQKEC
jgi:hypothetical protein